MQRDAKFFEIQVFYPSEKTLFLEIVQSLYNEFQDSDKKIPVFESLNPNEVITGIPTFVNIMLTLTCFSRKVEVY